MANDKFFLHEIEAIKCLTAWSQDVYANLDREVDFARAVPGSFERLMVAREGEFNQRISLAKARYSDLRNLLKTNDGGRNKMIYHINLGVCRKDIESVQQDWTVAEARHRNAYKQHLELQGMRTIATSGIELQQLPNRESLSGDEALEIRYSQKPGPEGWNQQAAATPSGAELKHLTFSTRIGDQEARKLRNRDQQVQGSERDVVDICRIYGQVHDMIKDQAEDIQDVEAKPAGVADNPQAEHPRPDTAIARVRGMQRFLKAGGWVILALVIAVAGSLTIYFAIRNHAQS